MRYEKRAALKSGRDCLIRTATGQDAQAVYDLFLLTHRQTDFLSSYADETDFDVAFEERFLAEKERSEREAFLCAFVDGLLAGTASVFMVGSSEKLRHRAEFGVGVDEAFWGQGIGRALLEAAIACAVDAGYAQLELGVVSENRRAVALYESAGFCEYGRNPRGFRSRRGVWQEEILMRLELR